MVKKNILLTILILGITSQLSLADNVSFKSTNKGNDGKPLMLTGILKKPEGDGPFPAVVLLHGCAGIDDANNRDKAWANRLVGWDYVTLQVDSFRPRNMSNICANLYQLFAMSSTRAQDAYDAKSYLTQIPFVDRNRIAVFGWSHGGWTVLNVISKSSGDSFFKAAVAFYPLCGGYLNNINAPLMILIGELDDWTPAKRCFEMMPPEQPDPEVILKIYPGAYHDFDWEGMDEIYEGHRTLFDPIATQDAIKQVKSFLAKHLM